MRKNQKPSNETKNKLIEKNNDTKKATNDFFNLLIKTCVLSQWRHQIIARKYQKKSNNRKPNKKDQFLINTKKLFNAASNIFSDHVVNYLYDLYDNMGQLPMRPGVKHDKNFGTIQIVNNRTLEIKSKKRIRFLSKLYFIIRINTSLESILIQSINKMKDNKKGRK